MLIGGALDLGLIPMEPLGNSVDGNDKKSIKGSLFMYKQFFGRCFTGVAGGFLGGMFFLNLTNHCQAQDFLKANSGEGEPAHLVPANVEYPRYRALIEKSLVPTSSFKALMIIKPSSEAESSLFVYEKYLEESKDEDSVENDGGLFVLSVVKAKNNLWHQMEASKGQLDNVEIERFDQNISRQLAISIQRAWAEMLLKTQYPSFPFLVGSGGTTVEFGVFVHRLGFLRGETLSPRWGLTKRMLTLGTRLQELVITNGKMTAKIEEELIKDLKELEESARESRGMTPTQEKDLLDSIKTLEDGPRD